ncbi:NIF3L1 [Branchiostoma lanceolatum]|uniref:NIF3-like protein 1 n=1 Tax=Branchiostoma lanceolatum TaxID=7740 RepID=A0A8J9YQ46_BRALA|nr:NIF3L1 [Branchiostoma lanceolatum]
MADLAKVVTVLNNFAPPSLAESWDNVGLLVEPSPPHEVSRMLLTNDLTEGVLVEAVEKKANLILSYHPPIFVPLKRLTQSSWKERIAVRCLENRIAVYSPHTAYDALKGGVNDWLAAGLGVGQVEPLHTSVQPHPQGHVFVLEVCVDKPAAVALQGKLAALQQGEVTTQDVMAGSRGNCIKINMRCSQHALVQAVDCVNQTLGDKAATNLQVVKLEKPPLPGTGMGRLVTLDVPVTMSDLLSRVKTHLGLNHVRLGMGEGRTLEGSTVRSVALCAGSGGSVLKGVKADVYLTGEMSHHDILDAVAMGTSVILCEHSNTERGFLRVLQGQLTAMLDGKVEVMVSDVDKDPVEVV